MKLSIMLLKLCLKKQMEYKLNFFLLCVAVAPIHLLQLVFSWIIARRFNGFAGWNEWDLIFLYGLLLSTYSIAQVLFRRFRYLEEFIINGDLDTYFLRPQKIIYSLIFYNLNIMEIFSQLMPSILILIISCVKSNISWNLGKVIIIIAALLGGTIIQACVFWVIGIISFWTMRSSKLESLYFSFKEFLNYPIHVYGKEILFFLTYVIPLAFVNYYPARYILGKDGSGNVLNYMTLPVAIIMLFIMSKIWHCAIKKYSSTGS